MAIYLVKDLKKKKNLAERVDFTEEEFQRAREMLINDFNFRAVDKIQYRKENKYISFSRSSSNSYFQVQIQPERIRGKFMPNLISNLIKILEPKYYITDSSHSEKPISELLKIIRHSA